MIRCVEKYTGWYIVSKENVWDLLQILKNKWVFLTDVVSVSVLVESFYSEKSR